MIHIPTLDFFQVRKLKLTDIGDLPKVTDI